MSEKDPNKNEGQEPGGEGMGTPENYFESFSSRLFSKIKVNEDLKDYPLLSSLEKQNPFVVPTGYFEAKEELSQYALLHTLKQNNFAIPANYFEEFPAALANKIVVEEEVREFASLAAVSKENVFAVPVDYFDGFYGSVKEVVSPARVVPLYGRVLKKYSFALAAAVLLLLTFTIVLINQKTDVDPNNDCNTFACLSKKEILNSAALQNISEENLIEMIDVEALSDSLSIKKGGKVEKVSADEVSDEIDVNTLTEEL